MSGDDEADLERALALDPRYLALVGSRKRLAEMAERLRTRGVPVEPLAQIKGPAGLDIGAATATEIAISIMAEMVLRRRGRQPEASAPAPDAVPSVPAPAPNEAIDPVCGMRVTIPGARHVLEHDGRTFYFCCPACNRVFAGDPSASAKR